MCIRDRDKAKQLRSDYIDNVPNVVKDFQNHIYHLLSSISKFGIPKNLDYESLLCSILNFANCIEGAIYNLSEKQYQKKMDEEEKLSIKTPMGIYAILEVNFPHPYVFSKESVVYIFNKPTNQKIRMENLTDEMIEMLNNTHPSMRGSIIYDYFTN